MAIHNFFIILSMIKKISLILLFFIFSISAHTDDGETLYEYRCKICHGAVDRVPGMNNYPGPSLLGIIGRETASDKSFSNYSNAIKSLDYSWTEVTLDEFLTSPMQVVPGTIMAFIGIKDEEQRKALIDYLIKNSSVNSK